MTRLMYPIVAQSRSICLHRVAFSVVECWLKEVKPSDYTIEWRRRQSHVIESFVI